MATHFRLLTIKEVRKETADCVSILFDIPEQWKEEFIYKPGQNITIKFQVNGEDIRRSYSICSSPPENELRIAVKKVDQGRFSSHANINLKKGDVLEVLPPTGRFIPNLQTGQAKKYIAFAAGSGITPILSIIKSTFTIEPESYFILIYANRSRASIIFREELEALKDKFMERFSLFHILSRERSDSPLNEGRIDIEKCMALNRIINLYKADEYFICGPEQLILTIRKLLEENLVERKNIHYELFSTPGQQLNNRIEKHIKEDIGGKKSRITVKSDGIAFDFDLAYDTKSILDAAIEQGADLPFACKGGVCSTCRARLLEGSVEMDVNYALEQDELEAGYILTCQSHPRTEKVTIDYDSK